jgi:DNA gyrase subunit B/topoisomerase-4 subunit B
MTPEQLKQTTLDPKKRVTLRVCVPAGEELETERVISDLMGKDAGARFTFITERAHEADELDV